MNSATFDDCNSFLETFDNELKFWLDLLYHSQLLLVSVSLNKDFYVQILNTLNIKGVEYDKKSEHRAHQKHVNKVVFKLVQVEKSVENSKTQWHNLNKVG
jgi:hypothetical protein